MARALLLLLLLLLLHPRMPPLDVAAALAANALAEDTLLPLSPLLLSLPGLGVMEMTVTTDFAGESVTFGPLSITSASGTTVLLREIWRPDAAPSSAFPGEQLLPALLTPPSGVPRRSGVMEMTVAVEGVAAGGLSGVTVDIDNPLLATTRAIGTTTLR